MSRKNPENKPLRIVRGDKNIDEAEYQRMLIQLAVAQSSLIRAKKDSAWPHFVAIVKEIEKYYDFTFEQIDDTQEI